MERKRIISILLLSILLTLSILLLYFSYYKKEKNNCNDTDTNIQWEVLNQKYPDDMQVHALHALRIGLFFKTGRGDITVSQATAIYENMRNTVIDAKANGKDKELEEPKKEGKRLKFL